jgi:Mrp family chromosome partitioning ATPase
LEQTADLRDEAGIPDEKNSEALPRTDFSQFENVTSVGPDSAGRLDAILQEAASAFDLVIVDLPPLSEGATIGAAAQKLDGILLVLKWGADAAEVRRALEFSAVARAKCAGVILNMATERLIGRYGDALAGAQARLTMRSRETNAPKDKTTGQEGEVAPA